MPPQNSSSTNEHHVVALIPRGPLICSNNEGLKTHFFTKNFHSIDKSEHDLKSNQNTKQKESCNNNNNNNDNDNINNLSLDNSIKLQNQKLKTLSSDNKLLASPESKILPHISYLILFFFTI